MNALPYLKEYVERAGGLMTVLQAQRSRWRVGHAVREARDRATLMRRVKRRVRSEGNAQSWSFDGGI